MKYAIALIIGFLTGIVIFVAGFYYNPFAGQATVSPLVLGEQELLDLSFPAVPGEAIVFSNDGESTIAPHPEKVPQLWEPAIRNTSVFITMLDNSRGQPAGIGVKFSSDSEDTRVLNSEALINSVWHVYLAGRGTIFVDQTENYWSYLKDIFLPARWSSGDNWRGSWHSVMTVGPGALGTARVTGVSGEFAGLNSEAVESLSARAYSAVEGPVAMNGALTISLPRATANQNEQEPEDRP